MRNEGFFMRSRRDICPRSRGGRECGRGCGLRGWGETFRLPGTTCVVARRVVGIEVPVFYDKRNLIGGETW